MNIRQATKEDIEKCEELISIPELTYGDGENVSVGFIENYLEDGLFFVAEDESRQIIGTVLGEKLAGKGAILWMRSVRNDFRDLGIGSKLADHFEKEAQKQGVKWIIRYIIEENERLFESVIKRGYKQGHKTVEFVKEL